MLYTAMTKVKHTSTAQCHGLSLISNLVTAETAFYAICNQYLTGTSYEFSASEITGTRMVVQQLVQASNKENIKDPYYRPLWPFPCHDVIA